MKNNEISLSGKVVSGFKLSHNYDDESFYEVNLKILRTSGQSDIVPLLISDKLVNVRKSIEGDMIGVNGSLRTYNYSDNDGNNHLKLSVFVDEIYELNEVGDSSDINNVNIDGFICKKPILRETPLGRTIGDAMIAVVRPYGKTDYIPIITWNRNAKYMSDLNVGDEVKISGRLQSRTYKKIINNIQTDRTAYEVSTQTVSLI